jgi:hypothetical protein
LTLPGVLSQVEATVVQATSFALWLLDGGG